MRGSLAVGRTQLDGDAFVGISPWLYREPSPNTFPFLTEHDLDWHLGIGFDVPIRGSFGLGVQVQYRAINSNIPGNTIKDLSVTIGPTASF